MRENTSGLLASIRLVLGILVALLVAAGCSHDDSVFLEKVNRPLQEIPMDAWNKVFWLVPVLVLGCSGTRLTALGVREGRLAPCPKSPNCVSTQSTDPKHRIDPFVYTSSMEEARDSLEKILRAMPRTRVGSLEGNYMHVECSSRLFRFVDDVEFWFDDEEKVIHFRSASRKGYSDLGVNRKRMERIREQFGANRQGP